MDTFKLSLFESFSLAWIGWATSGLILAIIGLFSPLTLLMALLAIAAVFVWLGRTGKIDYSRPDNCSLLVIGLTVAIGIGLSLFTAPTIFGGRDEGTYSTAAIMLANDHALSHQSPLIRDFYNIYGPGKALNFPGFYYTQDGELRSQFLPGFISWVGIFYSLFGLKGLAFVNLLPLVTLCYSFYLILRKILRQDSFLDPKTPAIGDKCGWFASTGLIILLSLFPLLLFYKFTLSEIFFAALIWFAFHSVLRYFESKSFAAYIIMFIPFPLMLFSRIETLGFVAVLLGILVFKDFNHMRQAKFQLIYALLGAVTVASLAYNSNFFLDTAKNILQPLMKKEPSSATSPLSDDLKNFYLPKVLFTYNILPLIIMGAAYVAYLAKRRKWRLLIPFIFFSPTLIYLIDANISLDHPWMLRRFLFAVIPLMLLYSVMMLADLRQTKLPRIPLPALSNLIIIILVVMNVMLLFPGQSAGSNFVTFRQNAPLLEQLEPLSSRLEEKDLLLVSQRSSGSGWSLLSEPMRTLYGKQAIYFFNPNDYGKLDRDNYGSIYLLINKDEQPHYGQLDKEPVQEMMITNTIVRPSKDPNLRPGLAATVADSVLYKLK